MEVPAPTNRGRGIASILEVELDSVPTHDPHLLPHQVPAKDLDRFSPRAPAVEAPLGEADEAVDPDMAEPRAYLCVIEAPELAPRALRRRGEGASQALTPTLSSTVERRSHGSPLEDLVSMVNASRVSMLVSGNRRPSGRARSSP